MRTRSSPSSAARTCSETELREPAETIAAEALEAIRKERPLPRIVLIGEMGAGKSTFARTLLASLGVQRPSEGSPTFAIAHEYHATGDRTVLHADVYRLKGEAELEETGLLEALWDPEKLVIIEWLDQFPSAHEALEESGLPVLTVRLQFEERSASLRRVEIRRSEKKTS